MDRLIITRPTYENNSEIQSFHSLVLRVRVIGTRFNIARLIPVTNNISELYGLLFKRDKIKNILGKLTRDSSGLHAAAVSLYVSSFMNKRSQ